MARKLALLLFALSLLVAFELTAQEKQEKDEYDPVKLLKDKNWWMRKFAAEELAHLPPEERAIQLLIQVLGDEKTEVSIAAAG